MLVIGITGRNCAGKDTVADVLEARGFERHSLSDALRDELAARGIEPTRTALIDVGRELRAAEGPAVLAERMKRKLRTARATLVSVRSPAEVAALRALEGFVLVAVEAPVEVRWERERSRRRERPAASFEEFVEIERREDSSDANAQQLGAAITLADRRILNDGTLDALERRVLHLLGDIDGR